MCWMIFPAVNPSYASESPDRQPNTVEQKVSDNLKHFWEEHGEKLLADYRSRLFVPTMETLPAGALNKKLSECKAVILTANYVEGTIVSQCLLEASG